MPIPRPIVVVLAFFQRAMQRSAGTRKDQYGEEVEARATTYLTDLDSPAQSLRRRIALINLYREYDLFDEECALLEKPLALHLRMIQLAASESDALEVTHRMLNEPPIAKLFVGMLKQAQVAGTTQVAIQFSAPDHPSVTVFSFEKGRWKEQMTIPTKLERPFRGFIVRVSKMGYGTFMTHNDQREHLPRTALFSWETDSRLEIVLHE